MDEELKSLLEKNLEVSQKSLEILKKIRRETMWSRAFSVIKWVIIIGFIIFGFMQIQPYLAYWSGVIVNIATNLENFNKFFLTR